MTRQQKVARSVVEAIEDDERHEAKSIPARTITAISAFFTIFHLRLSRFRNDLFYMLRNQAWEIDEDEYQWSFGVKGALQPKGDMGYSGSTFFNTADERYLVKSVPRQFEYSFFRDSLLSPYVDYMRSHPKSLLVRITDFLACEFSSMGGILGLAPTHHIVMENVLLGQSEARSSGGEKWQTFDLKPSSYFFPERDIAGGKLSSEATKARLIDKFEDKIILTRSQADELLAQLEEDTRLLEQCNTVDYSLFLVRIPLSTPQNPFADEPGHDNAPETPQNPPLAPPSPPTWRTGVKSADGKYVFRAVILDFFWAKHKFHAKFMTFLIKCWNLVDRQGPMSITTSSEEYRTRFLKMCGDMVEVKE